MRVYTFAIALSLLVLGTRVPAAVADEAQTAVADLAADRPKEVRLQAIRTLQKSGTLSERMSLAEHFDDDDADIRVSAINSLIVSALDRQEACPMVIIDAILGSRHADIRDLASGCVWVYEKVPQDAIPVFLKALQTGDPSTRASMPAVLSKFAPHDERTLPALRKATRDPDWGVRHNAYGGVWQVTDDFDEVLPYWLELVDGFHDDPDVTRLPKSSGRINLPHRTEKEISKLCNVKYLRQFGCNSLEREEFDAALIRALRNQSPVVRRSAARLVGTIAGKSAASRDFLDRLQAHEALRLLQVDRNASVRKAAEIALKEYDEGRPGPILPTDSEAEDRLGTDYP